MWRQETKIKITVLGDSGAGKTCLVMVLQGESFPKECHSTIIDKYQTTIDNTLVTIHDTGGLAEYKAKKEYKAIQAENVKDGNAYVLVYSVCDKASFKSVQDTFYPLIAEEYKNKAQNAVIFLCGNKCDLPADQHQVDSKVAKAFADQHNMGFIEASAKSNTNVAAPFKNVVQRANRLDPDEIIPTTKMLGITNGRMCVVQAPMP